MRVAAGDERRESENLSLKRVPDTGPHYAPSWYKSPSGDGRIRAILPFDPASHALRAGMTLGKRSMTLVKRSVDADIDRLQAQATSSSAHNSGTQRNEKRST